VGKNRQSRDPQKRRWIDVALASTRLSTFIQKRLEIREILAMSIKKKWGGGRHANHVKDLARRVSITRATVSSPIVHALGSVQQALLRALTNS
jgi:hypothetical protein